MNDLNATIGIVNLPHLPRIIAACQANADFFAKQLVNLPGVTLLPALPAGSSSAWWLYTIRVPAEGRDLFISMLKDKGITVSAVHQRNDVHSCVQRFSVLLPKLNVLADEIICLPVGWWLTDDDRKRIVSAVREFSSKMSASLSPSSSGVISLTKQRKKCIITGGCGFIGHHVVEHFAKNTDYQIIILDRLSYASKGYDRLRDTGVFHLLATYCYDLANPISPGLFYELDSNNVEVILHIAAETHVDNSIDTPVPFVENNIKSTLNLLEYARKCPSLKHFIYFSTDEVYGSAADGQAFKEGDPHKPSNPYSASKSAAEMICQSYYNTYNVPLVVMNVMNAFGERQHPEKFIPLCINKISRGEELTIHAYAGAQRAGSRWYIHARNIAGAVLFVLKQGKLGEKYNVQGEIELDNLAVAQFVAKELGKELKYKMHDNPTSRPGHDLRYSLDGTKLQEMGWVLPLTFEDSLRKTIHWTLNHPSWMDVDTFLHMPPADDTPVPTRQAGAAVREVVDAPRSKL